MRRQTESFVTTKPIYDQAVRVAGHAESDLWRNGGSDVAGMMDSRRASDPLRQGTDNSAREQSIGANGSTAGAVPKIRLAGGSGETVASTGVRPAVSVALRLSTCPASLAQSVAKTTEPTTLSKGMSGRETSSMPLASAKGPCCARRSRPRTSTG
jgi:hypothetical protein